MSHGGTIASRPAAGSAPSTLHAPLVAALALALTLPVRLSGESNSQEPPPREEAILGRPSAFGADETAEDRIWVEAGRRLHERPDPRSAVLDTVTALAELPLIERRGPWALVRYGVWKGWVFLASEEAAEILTATPIPLSMRDRGLIRRLREILGDHHVARRLGPYTLYSDVKDRGLIERLGSVTANLRTAYRERFSLDPGPVGDETVFLFASQEDYRSFEESEPAVSQGAPGHASLGVCVTFVGHQDEERLRKILIHELTHLLNRRALGPPVTPWLEEGLAEELALSSIDGSGKLLKGTLGGTTKERRLPSDPGRRTSQVTFTGGRAALQILLEAWSRDSRPPISVLLDLSLKEFVKPSVRAIHYAESGLLVRYLLDGGGVDTTERFTSFLRSVASGQPAFGWAVLAAMELDEDTLEREFYLWLRRLAKANRVPYSTN